MTDFDWIDEAVAARIGDGSTRFVYPSAVVAENRAARALSRSGFRAVRADRFLGWDEFRDSLTAGQDRRRLADARIREIFAAGLMRKNAEAPFLSTLVSPDRAAESSMALAPWVASRLPELAPLAPSRGFKARDARGALADWAAIAAAYEAFLEERTLRDGAWAPSQALARPGKAAVFLSALVEDFAPWRAALQAAGVEILDPPSEACLAQLPFVKRASALAEIRGTLRALTVDLDAGIPAGELAISAADLEFSRPWLEREAELLGIPLDVRAGKPLAALPGGRFFPELGRASSSRWSGPAVASLLSDEALPWKNPGIVRAILRRGIERHAVAPWTEDGRERDPWEEALRGSPEAAEGWRRIRESARRIANAKDYAALSETWMTFRNTYLSDEGWDPVADAVVARCVAELRELDAAAALSGGPGPEPFRLFLRRLEGTVYVSAATGAGVRVFPWRLAAGARFRRHYLLGASLDSAEVVYARLGFLRDDLRAELGAEDSDASADFLAAYAASADRAFFSCPPRGARGDQAPHGALLRRAVRAAEPEGPDAPDCRREEEAWLSDGRARPAALSDPLAEGCMAAARTGLAGRAKVLPGALGPEAAAKAIERRMEADAEGGLPWLRLDPSTMDQYAACGFAALAARLLAVEREPTGIDFADDRFLGEVYHAALEAFWKRVKAEHGAFRPEKRAEYRAWVPEAVAQGFLRSAERFGPFALAVLEALAARIEWYVAALLDAELEAGSGYFANLEVLDVEEERTLRLDTERVKLSGRLDRVQLKDGKAVIVDYKKSGIPTKSAVRGEEGPDGSRRLGEAQMPAYQALVEAGGLGLASAWYASVEGNSDTKAGSFRCALGDGPDADLPEAALDSVRKAFAAALSATARGLRAGLYLVPDPAEQEKTCKQCRTRAVCRERYAARVGDDARARRPRPGPVLDESEGAAS
ncbi:MAG: PD-(D/E)XK nuclease family protein [Spirochaetales bacterium]|nr:PD-(D/E)XK nuclease family protein [Spirochaetales bacterium]